MSLPTPHIQALSSYKVNRRESTILRNISSPFSLAIPPRAAKPKQRPRSEVPLQIRPPSGSDDEIEDSQNDDKKSQFLQVPKRPKKAVLVFEKPVLPDDSLYELETDSNRTASSGSHGSRQSKLTRPKIAEIIKNRINDRIIALAVTLTLAILLAIAIPLGVILPQKHMAPLPINILVPLYMDPVDGAWQRLNDQIVKHHDSQFTIIINPTSDSSNITHPSKAYLESLKTLTTYPNVCVVGYVDTNNGQRANASVRADVVAYAAWSKISHQTALHGVYFDHTPWEYDKSGLAKAYLHNVSATVRDTHGWADGLSGLVMQNPGQIPDARLVAGDADLVVVFDGMHEDMQAPEVLATFLQESNMTRSDLAMLISHVPVELGRVGMRKLIERAKKEVEWFYLTDAQDVVGNWFPSFFEDWLDVTF